jgi:hypothetical protein
MRLLLCFLYSTIALIYVLFYVRFSMYFLQKRLKMRGFLKTKHCQPYIRKRKEGNL